MSSRGPTDAGKPSSETVKAPATPLVHHLMKERAYKPLSRFNPKRISAIGLKNAHNWLDGE